LVSSLLCLFSGAIGSVFRIAVPERRALYLVSGVCVLVAGLAQMYDGHFLGTVLGSSDGGTFLLAIESGQTSFHDIQRIVDTPLAVAIWQAAYRGVAAAGLPTGPWLPVLINSFCVGWSALLTVKIAREVWGDDAQRLHRVGTLCAACGVMWLFGALLLRDCFTLAITNLCLWSYSRLVARGQLSSVYLTAAVTVLSMLCLRYLRPESSYGIMLFGAVAAALWVWHRQTGLGRIAVVLLVGMLGLSALAYLKELVVEASELSARMREFYSEGSIEGVSGQSLGVRFVVNQPLPIRVVAGSLTLLVYPIPLWRSFQLEASAYEWIKNCHGLFMLLSVPAMATGCFIAFADYLKGRPERIAACYLAIVALLALALVAVTSLETRHHGQFIAPALVTAAVPGDTLGERRLLGRISLLWFGGVYAIHLLWIVYMLDR